MVHNLFFIMGSSVSSDLVSSDSCESVLFEHVRQGEEIIKMMIKLCCWIDCRTIFDADSLDKLLRHFQIFYIAINILIILL